MALTLPLSAVRGLDTAGFAGGAESSSTAGAASITGPSFSDMLKTAAENTVGDLHNAEQLSMKALKGDADIRDVTDAVMSAEQNLQAAIAIRDKIVTAFLEISRMQI